MVTGLSVESVLPWLGSFAAVAGEAALRIAVILVVGYVAVRFVTVGLRQLERVIILANEAGELTPGTAKKRAATLTGILRTIALAMIWAIVIIEVLHQVGLDIRPILA